MLRLLFILILLLTKCFAQNPVCRIINNATGLPSNTVYQIIQDEKGFIWIAHDKGLSKYDGNSFINYKSPSQQGSSLSNINIFKDNIWCQDFAGNFYYSKNETLYKETKLHSGGNYFAAAKYNDKLAFIRNDSLCFINGNNNEVTKTSIPKLDYITITTDSQQIFLYAKNHLVAVNNGSSQIVQSFNNTQNFFFFLLKVNNNIYGITKNTHPYIFLLKDNKTIPLNALPEKLIIQDASVINDEIWISTSTGSYCFDKSWKPKYNGFCFYKEHSITKVIKDREGNYWFSTLNNGVLIVPDLNTRLYNFQNKSITALAKKNNEILAGTSDHSVLSFNLKSNNLSQVYKDNTNHEILGLKYDNLTKLTLYWSDRIAYLRGNKKTNEHTNFAAKSITEIDENFYAVAYASGIALIRRNNKETPVPEWLKTKKNVWIDSKYNLLDATTRGRSVLFDNNTSTLYAATANGIYYFSKTGSGKIKHNDNEIFASQIIKLKNTIYITTFSNGLYKLTDINNSEGIKNNNISNTLYKATSDNSSLWLIGENCLQEYNTETNNVITYTAANGLPKSELKDVVVKENQIFLATTQGLLVIDKLSKSNNNTAPLLSLNHISVNGHIVDSVFDFKSHENNIIIDFSLLSYKAENTSLKTQYKINNGEWQNLESLSRQLSLPSLASGNYTIQIRGFNEDGVVSKNIITVGFSIAAPYYKQWWFIVSVALAVLAVLLLIFKSRIKNIKQRNELLAQKLLIEHELNKSTLTSIKSQMNPHFLFNALNTIQSYIYTNDKENASEYLVKFSQLTRLILDMSNKDYVSIADEIKALKLYIELEQQRFEDKLQSNFIIDENISTETQYIPSMLIQPYIENAIKHGLLHKKGTWILKINIDKKPAGIQVTIDDNGIGRKRSEQLNKHKMKHQSFATKANEKRLEILNRGLHQNIGINITDKEDAHGNALGTTVVLFIPTQNKPD